MAATLHCRVTSVQEARFAEHGGADRLIVTSDDPALSPLPEVIAQIRGVASLDMRVMLRLRAGVNTDGGGMTRLRGLAFSYADAGADGFVFGFLNAMMDVDLIACAELAGDEAWRWTFDRCIDSALDQDRAWADINRLPRLDSVMTAGSPRGITHGIDRLIDHASGQPVPVIAAGGLSPEHVPWLARGGVRQFCVDTPPVSDAVVRSWRQLIDDEVRRAEHT